MPVKLHLNTNYVDPAYLLFGFASNLKDYRVTFFINKALGIDLRRLDDLIIIPQGRKESCNYSFYYYEDHELKTDYFMISNHHPDAKLIPEWKQTDYFLLLHGEMRQDEQKALIKKLVKTTDIFASFKIDLAKVKNAALLLNDIEIHLMEAEKRNRIS